MDDLTTKRTFELAFNASQIAPFMKLVFPPEWEPIAARIFESGATMSARECDYAPRWTPIPPTVRYGDSDLETHVKSCIYRAHDCLHQLWGLPIPVSWGEEDKYLYKRAQMCGEVAVLTLTEFVLVRRLAEIHPSLRSVLYSRNALPMLQGPLAPLTTREIAARLDGLLHRKLRPIWVRQHEPSMAFCDDYVPMLEEDRRLIDHNWKLLTSTSTGISRLRSLPNARYDSRLDGQELTLWMIDDFYHLLRTDPVVDGSLADFNRNRREGLKLPAGWNAPL